MAGITAQSATKTHASGSTSADASITGFLVNERITLGVSPAGTGFVWALAAPNDSSPARSAIDDDDDAAPSFIPDVSGYYVVSVTVDGTTSYVLRISVADVAIVRQAEGTHFLPLTDAQVPTPQTGFTLFCGADHSSLPCVKKSDGTVHTVDLTAV